VNNVRIIRCGDTVFVMGQLFDPGCVIDTRATTNPAEVATHLFDHLGLRGASNDDVVCAAVAPFVPGDHHDAR
jgi:hypothetical protein